MRVSRRWMAGTLVALPAAVALAQAPAPARPAAGVETFVVDRVHSDASFQIRHFVSKVRGRFREFEGTMLLDRARPEASSVEFRLKAASIDTDNQRRDDHLRSADFFDAVNHPDITFKSTKLTPKGNNRFDVTGTFTMRGVAKQITVPVTFHGTVKDNRGGEKAGFEVNTVINRKDYGVAWNQALEAGGFVLGDEVDVTINIEANKKPATPPSPAAN